MRQRVATGHHGAGASGWAIGRANLAAVLAALQLGLATGCGTGRAAEAAPAPGHSTSRVATPPARPTPPPGVPGDPSEGARLFMSAGCAGCHTLRGTPAASGVAGPNLTNIVLRPTLAGETIPMTPATLAAFLRDPSAVEPGTSMPSVGLTPAEAEHLAAFLYSQPYNPSP